MAGVSVVHVACGGLRRGPVFEAEDALDEGSGKREVDAEHGGEGFAEVPYHPVRGEGVLKGLVFVLCGSEDLWLCEIRELVQGRVKCSRVT